MKILLMSFLILTGCTDAELASWSALGNSGEVTCYSGDNVIYQGMSTGKIITMEKSDGWQFKESASGKLIRISGTCVIKN